MTEPTPEVYELARPFIWHYPNCNSLRHSGEDCDCAYKSRINKLAKLIADTAAKTRVEALEAALCEALAHAQTVVVYRPDAMDDTRPEWIDHALAALAKEL